MTNPQYDQEEERFLKEIGLDSVDLTVLVKDPPEVPADVAERVRGRVKRNLAPTRSSRRLWAALAAAVAGIALVGTLVSTGAAATLVERLYRLVPGVGVTVTGERTLVLAKPVAIPKAGHEMQVLGLLSNESGTQLRMRWTGATQARVPMAERPWLILPDGSRLQTPGGNSSLSDGILTWTITFKPLPPGTRAVRLELPPIEGITTETMTAELPLSASAAELAEAVPTSNPSVERQGVRVTVPSMSLAGDQIHLALNLEGRTADVVPARILGPAVKDDLGNHYHPDVSGGDLDQLPGLQLSVAFDGPIKSGAKRLTLTLAGVVTAEPGQADVILAVGDLPVGGSVQLDQTVALGRVSFRITEVTRQATNTYRLNLQPGSTPEGFTLRSFATRSYARDEQPPALNGNGEKLTIDLYQAPVAGHLTFYPVNPQVWRPGPFEVEIPLP